MMPSTASKGKSRAKKAIHGDRSVKVIKVFCQNGGSGVNISIDGTMAAGPSGMKSVMKAMTRKLQMATPAGRVLAFDLETEINDAADLESGSQYLALGSSEKVNKNKISDEFNAMVKRVAEIDLKAINEKYPNFSPARLEELKNIFDEYDEDKNGSLDFNEVYKIIAKDCPKPRPKKSEVAKALNELDEDNSGTLEFEEFIAVYTSVRKNKGPQDNKLVKAMRSRMCVIQ
eukprot:m.60596 g.60596  ORF g.60596 m.60596 type:complete len:230 (-) comp11336_c0_seq1:384-1073(-)